MVERIQHSSCHMSPESGVRKRCGDAEDPKLRGTHCQSQSVRIVDVIANVRVNDDRSGWDSPSCTGRSKRDCPRWMLFALC